MIQKLDSEVMQSLDVDVKDYGLRNCKNYPRTRRLVFNITLFVLINAGQIIAGLFAGLMFANFL